VGKNAGNLADALLLDLPAALGNRGVAESNVEDGAVLRGVNVLAGEHLVAEALDLGLAGKGEERREDLLVDEVLRVVEENGDIGLGRLELERVLVEALGVGSEELLENELGSLGLVELLKLLPGLVVWDNEFLGARRSRVRDLLVASFPVAILINVVVRMYVWGREEEAGASGGHSDI